MLAWPTVGLAHGTASAPPALRSSPVEEQPAEAIASTVREALHAKDLESILALLSHEVVISTQDVVIASEVATVHAWVRDCLLYMEVDEESIGIVGQRISWRFVDHSPCSVPHQPARGSPSDRPVLAMGSTDLVVHEGRIVSIRSLYTLAQARPWWEDRSVAAQVGRGVAPPSVGSTTAVTAEQPHDRVIAPVTS